MPDKIPDDYKRTVKAAFNVLAYGDNSARMLEEKLKNKGFSQESIEFSVNYMRQRGYINEMRYLRRLVDQLANQKYYGVNRIAAEIYKKGFALSLVRDNLGELFSEIDFKENCLKLALKTKRADRNRLFQYLIRAGHTVSDATYSVMQVYKDPN